MIEPTPATGVASLIAGAAPLLTMTAGLVLQMGTGHRLLGMAIIGGALLSLLGDRHIYSLAFSQDGAVIAWCELARQAGWFVVGISAVLLAAQRTMPGNDQLSGGAGFR